ncbi:MAG: hypothetical protein ACI8RD_010547, partial [Bacillariaceae sp.]
IVLVYINSKMKEKNKNFIKDRRTNQIVKEKETLENTHEFEIRHSTMYIYIYISLNSGCFKAK